MAKFRRLYFEPLEGQYHALFIGDNIDPEISYGDYVASPIIINHGKNSNRVLVSVFDSEGNELIPDKIVLPDLDTVEVHFVEQFKGKIHLTFF